MEEVSTMNRREAVEMAVGSECISVEEEHGEIAVGHAPTISALIDLYLAVASGQDVEAKGDRVGEMAKKHAGYLADYADAYMGVELSQMEAALGIAAHAFAYERGGVDHLSDYLGDLLREQGVDADTAVKEARRIVALAPWEHR